MPKPHNGIPDVEAMDKEIRATCKLLQEVAKNYPRGSAECAAIRDAADAFIFLRLHDGLRKSYEAFRRSCSKPLTKSQKQVLKRAGVTL
jgi:hypothetical protein